MITVSMGIYSILFNFAKLFHLFDFIVKKKS